MNHSRSFFEPLATLEKLPIIDGDLAFCPHFYQHSIAEDFMARLLYETDWRQEHIRVWGKSHAQPRLIAWHGDPDSAYSYSGITLAPKNWTPTLLQLKNDIQFTTGQCFNSVLLNLYRDGHDHIGWHSDDEPELGQHPVIASLSLGETRTFKLKHKTKANQKNLRFDLTSGSLLLMAGSTQQYWKHSVPKETKVNAARINLTFRRIFIEGVKR